ncbi:MULTISPECIES: trans-sulfuration enzyme family protein [Thermomonospora]|uniref:homocysteine desulfhydrase n=1 Tax=Thermomonospora curvata (strain ATCC 19995 / DSM 43183 / JCM 3096 / KCTC 9072 / NBRC 15933 / NCIMB 10081 / Henssen B9) TaxID=471852 RepID=D1AD43_THECD|nr:MULTISPECIES: aminotransferase class I/II-fold pyridoxal phosphate-dependent enzyme [Thermomonospora]ACY99352.1 Cystathionine gamma-synthase [Thermomonospora curvata DSM 43183]PKK12402.1 MAG: cystathionine gamma-synthase [Thermomonospora sp. CIF 1]
MDDLHRDLHPRTRAAHPPLIRPVGSLPLSTPIYQGHLFSFEDAEAMAAAFEGPARADEDGHRAFYYSRMGNPTVRMFEEAVNDLEGGAGALATGSGMGAVNAVLMSLLRSGDHVIAQRSLYGGTYTLLRDLAERWGVEVTHVSGDDLRQVRAALRPRTRLLYLETITNPTTEVVDLPALAALAREAGVLTAVDNTFATPVLCRPLEHGIDIVIHSATKYLGGHSDVLAGVVVCADADLYRRIWHHSLELGAGIDPMTAWLSVRGMATLPLRMAQHCHNALGLARRLAGHPAVERVHYPGLESHPHHRVARRLLDGGFGGVLSIDLAGGREAGRVFAESLRLVRMAPSLGGTKTLVLHPASTSHRGLDERALAEAGIGAGTVRLAVGIEDLDDLWDDIEQALAKASRTG